MFEPAAEHIVDDQPPIVLNRDMLSRSWHRRMIAYWRENGGIAGNVTRRYGGANAQETGDEFSISKAWSIKKHKRGFEIIRRRV
jgi:hypothetical protein